MGKLADHATGTPLPALEMRTVLDEIADALNVINTSSNIRFVPLSSLLSNESKSDNSAKSDPATEQE